MPGKCLTFLDVFVVLVHLQGPLVPCGYGIEKGWHSLLSLIQRSFCTLQNQGQVSTCKSVFKILVDDTIEH